MEAKEIYLKIKREITKGLYAYDDQIAAIAKWVESEFEPKKQGKKLPIHDIVFNEAVICHNCHKYKRMQGNGMMHQLCECSSEVELVCDENDKRTICNNPLSHECCNKHHKRI